MVEDRHEAVVAEQAGDRQRPAILDFGLRRRELTEDLQGEVAAGPPVDECVERPGLDVRQDLPGPRLAVEQVTGRLAVEGFVVAIAERRQARLVEPGGDERLGPLGSPPDAAVDLLAGDLAPLGFEGPQHLVADVLVGLLIQPRLDASSASGVPTFASTATAAGADRPCGLPASWPRRHGLVADLPSAHAAASRTAFVPWPSNSQSRSATIAGFQRAARLM